MRPLVVLFRALAAFYALFIAIQHTTFSADTEFSAILRYWMPDLVMMTAGVLCALHLYGILRLFCFCDSMALLPF